MAMMMFPVPMMVAVVSADRDRCRPIHHRRWGDDHGRACHDGWRRRDDHRCGVHRYPALYKKSGQKTYSRVTEDFLVFF
jgi:hypothetical protein